MLVGTALVSMHLMMVDCPTDRPNDPSCLQAVSMDIYGPEREASQMCELNAKFINPNIKQAKGRHLEMQCWTPLELRRLKIVL